MPRQPTCKGQRNPHCTANLHGTQYAYSHRGCRCQHARNDNRIYRKRLREGRHTNTFIDATGTARRLQGLNAQGHRLADLAAELGYTKSRIWKWANMTSRLVHRDTADQVKALTHRLSHRTGPSEMARRRAAERGWVSLAAWNNIDDPNDQPQTTAVGDARLNQFRQLHAAGAGYRQIRVAMGLNSQRYRELLAQTQTAGDIGSVAA